MFGGNRESEFDPVMVGAVLAVLAGLCALAFMAVEWPVLAWSTVHLDPMLLSPADAIGGALHNLFATHPFRYPPAWHGVVKRLPPPRVWIALDVLGTAVTFLVLLAAAVRLERWRGRSRYGLRPWDPRWRLSRRSWAAPRDLLHLQRRRVPPYGEIGPVGYVRAVKNRVMRALAGERRAAWAAGGDSWALGLVHGTEVRSGPEEHAVVVAPTGSGKTRRVVSAAVAEHRGAVVSVSTKLDVYRATVQRRVNYGRARIFAPGLGLDPQAPQAVRWTPLAGCQEWEYALHMGRWIYEASPDLGRDQSAGAQFFNKEATEVVLPALLHAAALGGRSMRDVYAWVSGDGVVSFDEPAEILTAHHATAALSQLRAVQHMPDRQRSYSITSARQLLSAYQHDSVNAYDADEFDIEAFVSSCDTLYLSAPESMTDLLAPILGALIAAILRACEQRAQRVADPRRLALVRIVVDEAAHLAPLRELPTYLAVSRSWGCRLMVVYQSIAQLRQRYHRDADAILANTLTKLFLGPIHDRATREELVALLGEERVTDTTHNTDGFGRSRGRSRREHYRPKTGAVDLATLGAGYAIVIHKDDLPFVTHVPFYDEPRRGGRRR